jgi:Flp pilus assembly pilin Flp
MKDQFKSTAERGQGLVEYALILVLVATVVIVGLSLVGTSVQDVYCQVVAGLGSSSDQCGTGKPNITNNNGNNNKNGDNNKNNKNGNNNSNNNGNNNNNNNN